MKRALLALTGLAAALALTGCEDPPVRQVLVITPQPDGRVHVSITTTFKELKSRKAEDVDPIRREQDSWVLGRDAWLRGLERAQAAEIGHTVEGPEREIVSIQRTGVLPSARALERLLPDSIAFFRMETAEDGTMTLEIRHHDMPERLRDHWRAIERELDALAETLLPMANAQCALYEYIREHPDRRADLVMTILSEGEAEVLIEPEEAVLLDRLHEKNGPLERFLDPPKPFTPPLISRLTFAPFDFNLCVALGIAPVLQEGFPIGGNDPAASLHCLETTSLVEILNAGGAVADPRMLGHQFEDAEKIAKEEDPLAEATFACAAPSDEVEIRRRAWARIMPRESYRLVWSPDAADETKTEPDGPGVAP